MQFVEGCSLHDRLRARAADPRHERRRIVADRGRSRSSGTSTAAGIDPSRPEDPSNILLDAGRDQPFVTDSRAGEAGRRRKPPDAKRRRSWARRSTWRPSRRSAGDKTSGPAADVFWLGAILPTEVSVAGGPPFREPTMFDTLMASSRRRGDAAAANQSEGAGDWNRLHCNAWKKIRPGGSRRPKLLRLLSKVT